MANPAHARHALLAGLLLAPILACQLFVTSDVYQCSNDGDCASRGGEFANRKCLASVCVARDVADADKDASTSDASDAGDAGDAGGGGPFGCAANVYPEENPLRHVTYTRVFQDVTAGTPLTAIAVQVCAIIDPNCTAPRIQADGGLTLFPDVDGKVTVDVLYGFNGLLQVTDIVDGGGKVTPALIQVTPPVVEDAAVGPPALMVSPSVFAGVAASVFGGGAVDPTLGHIFFRTHDCLDQGLAGISVDADRSDPKTRSFYFTSGNIPDPGAVQTDKGAKGGILNLPPGTINLTARFFDTKKKMGSVAVKLRAGFVTYVIVTPTL